MKYTLKKSLAVLLAMLMLLGAMATGTTASNDAAAEPAATGEEPTLSDAQDPAVVSSEAAETEAADVTAAEALDFESAEELLFGEPKAVSLAVTQFPSSETKLFKFTPAESGGYCFRSGGAQGGIDPRIDPFASLYDEAGNDLGFSSDRWDDEESSLNFAVFRALEAGKTYYLAARAFYGGDFTVRVDTYSKKLAAPQKEITIKTDEYVRIADLIVGTTWGDRDLDIEITGGIGTSHKQGEGQIIYGVKGGKAELKITAPDGEKVEIKVKVKYTTKEWIRYYLLGGWLIENREFEAFFAPVFFWVIAIASFFINIVLLPFDLIEVLFDNLFR